MLYGTSDFIAPHLCNLLCCVCTCFSGCHHYTLTNFFFFFVSLCLDTSSLLQEYLHICIFIHSCIFFNITLALYQKCFTYHTLTVQHHYSIFIFIPYLPRISWVVPAAVGLFTIIFILFFWQHKSIAYSFIQTVYLLYF